MLSNSQLAILLLFLHFIMPPLLYACTMDKHSLGETALHYGYSKVNGLNPGV